MKKIATFFIFGLAFNSLTAPSKANIPPPPVNQKLGIPDSVFNNLSGADCRLCHENTNVVTITDISGRHHLLVEQNKVIPPGSVVPFPEGSTTGTYQCTSCHVLVWTDPPGAMTYSVYKDCTQCHVQKGASVHHLTERAQRGVCKSCHGSFVENPAPPGVNPPWIPTYAPSLVTPWPSGKPNSGPNGEGNCNFCHNQGVVTDPAFVNKYGAVNPVAINSQTHHDTGFGYDTSKCGWCHDFNQPPIMAIRRCENCHSLASLHNIQSDSPAPASIGKIDPTREQPGWGHIGNNWDCYGCHGFVMSQSMPKMDATIPSLNVNQDLVAVEGEGTRIALSGTSFVDSSEIPVFVELEDIDGARLIIPSKTQNNNNILAFMPNNLKAGNYRLRLVKDDKYSNCLNISVVPNVLITSVSRRQYQMLIDGKGFGKRPQGTEDYLYVSVNGNPIEVLFWSDTSIIAAGVELFSLADKVTVNTLFGSASAEVTSVKDHNKKIFQK